MSGVVVTFSLDLIMIPCLILATGNSSELGVNTTIKNLPVNIQLSQKGAPSITNAHGTRRFIYNKISISITKQDEDLTTGSFIAGRARYILQEFQEIVLEALNRMIFYFKYEKRQPNLRALSFYDLLKQEEEFYNPTWKTLAGTPLQISNTPAESGVHSIPGLIFLRDGFFGISLFTPSESSDLEQWLSSENHDISLDDQLLSDAQSAVLTNNVRRGVLELVISIEIAVKSTFFKEAKIASTVFEFLEDKGRSPMKVLELLDGVAANAFGESFKTAYPDAYKDIDHAFRCRNKIAHRGEVRFRDDSGAWQIPDRDLLMQWWKSTIDLRSWLKEKMIIASSDEL